MDLLVCFLFFSFKLLSLYVYCNTVLTKRSVIMIILHFIFIYIFIYLYIYIIFIYLYLFTLYYHIYSPLSRKQRLRFYFRRILTSLGVDSIVS